MTITPVELHHLDLKRGLFGYRRGSVDLARSDGRAGAIARRGTQDPSPARSRAGRGRRRLGSPGGLNLYLGTWGFRPVFASAFRPARARPSSPAATETA